MKKSVLNLTLSPSLSLVPAGQFLKQPPAEFKPVTSNPHIRVFQNGSLAIHSAQKSDAAFYLCQATNGIGPDLSKVFKLTVNGKRRRGRMQGKI